MADGDSSVEEIPQVEASEDEQSRGGGAHESIRGSDKGNSSSKEDTDEDQEDQSTGSKAGSDEEVYDDQDERKAKKSKSPKNKRGQGYGTENCSICGERFEKNASNHKVCTKTVCQQEQTRRRNEAKKDKVKKKHQADVADREKRKLEKAFLEMVAAKEKANSEKAARIIPKKRKSAPIGSLAGSVPQKRAKGAQLGHRDVKLPTANTHEDATTGRAEATLPGTPELTEDPASFKKRPPAPKGNSDIVRVVQQIYFTHGPQNEADQMKSLLDWKECTRAILQKGYQIIDLNFNYQAASMNIHCELMQQAAAPLWDSCVRQGWEYGQSLNLDLIQVDHHKTENFKPCREIIDACKSIMNKLSQKMWAMKKNHAKENSRAMPPEAKHRGGHTNEVSYVSYPAGEHRHEFVHADSMVQGDVMALMPLFDDSVQPKFYPYEWMGGHDQGPITREDKTIEGEEPIAAVRRKIEQMTQRFHPLVNTTDGAAVLHEAMFATSKLRPGNLLVYLGDALHALPAGNRKTPERYLYFRTRPGGNPKPKGGDIPNGTTRLRLTGKYLPGVPEGPEAEGASAKAASKQSETEAAVGAGSEVASEDPGVAGTEGGSAKAASKQQDATGRSKKAAVCGDSEVARKGTATEAPGAPAGSRATAVGAGSKVAGIGSAKLAPSGPGSTGTKGGSAKAASKRDATDSSEKASDCAGSEFASKGTANPDTEGGSPKAASEQAKTAGNEGAAVGVGPEVASEGIGQDAHRDPDGHGVIDALRVLKYADDYLIDCAAVHNLIAAGYKTMDEAGGFYKKRYPEKNQTMIDSFLARFLSIYHKETKTSKLVTAKVPSELTF